MALRVYTKTTCVLLRSALCQYSFKRILIHTQYFSSFTRNVTFANLHVNPPRVQPLYSAVVNFTRSYAKKAKKEKKDKGGKKGGGKPKVDLSTEELNEVLDYDKMEHQLELALTHLKQDYMEQLSLRTSSGVFDSLMVETPEGKFPLIQLAQVTQKNPQLIIINLTSVPQYVPAVKSAIEKSGMNLNPQLDGSSLFVPVPKITREHREGMAKNAKTLCDKAKEKMRDIQNRFLKESKKAKDHHSEDLVRGAQEHIQMTAKSYMGQAEDLMHMKQNELLGK